MREHPIFETSESNEPEDGWVASPPLMDTVITSITLCRFSGMPRNPDRPCANRRLGRHENVDCESLYFQADALASGKIDQAAFPESQAVTRTHTAGDDPIGTTS